MKVSNLAVVPPASNWRMNFTANAPFAGISPPGDYSFALSGRGDMFYVQANTDASTSGTFTWGTAVRNSDGSITHTSRGAADCGAFYPATGTITVKVDVGKLNQFAPKGSITTNSVLAGLRGQTFTSAADGKRDITRGGTEFTGGGCAASPANGCGTIIVTPTPTPTATPTPSTTPTPTATPTPATSASRRRATRPSYATSAGYPRASSSGSPASGRGSTRTGAATSRTSSRGDGARLHRVHRVPRTLPRARPTWATGRDRRRGRPGRPLGARTRARLRPVPGKAPLA